MRVRGMLDLPALERAVEAAVPVPAVPDDASEAYRRGAQLYRAASCVGCHSPPFSDAEHLGGGRERRRQQHELVALDGVVVDRVVAARSQRARQRQAPSWEGRARRTRR